MDNNSNLLTNDEENSNDSAMEQESQDLSVDDLPKPFYGIINEDYFLTLGRVSKNSNDEKSTGPSMKFGSAGESTGRGLNDILSNFISDDTFMKSGKDLENLTGEDLNNAFISNINSDNYLKSEQDLDDEANTEEDLNGTVNGVTFDNTMNLFEFDEPPAKKWCPRKDPEETIGINNTISQYGNVLGESQQDFNDQADGIEPKISVPIVPKAFQPIKNLVELSSWICGKFSQILQSLYKK